MEESHEFRVKARFDADEPYVIGIYHKDSSGEHGDSIEFNSLQEVLMALEDLKKMVVNASIDPYII